MILLKTLKVIYKSKDTAYYSVECIMAIKSAMIQASGSFLFYQWLYVRYAFFCNWAKRPNLSLKIWLKQLSDSLPLVFHLLATFFIQAQFLSVNSVLINIMNVKMKSINAFNPFIKQSLVIKLLMFASACYYNSGFVLPNFGLDNLFCS